MRHAIIAVLLLAALAGTAVAGPYEDAISAYERGDYNEAARLYRRAAEQGHAVGQLKLGSMYGNGEGVPQDDAEAAKWYRLAAEQGHAVGQLSLGNMYRRGQGVPQDDVKAYKWFNLAGSQIVSAFLSRDRVAAKMTPAQIAEAQKLAREWKPK